MKREDVMIEWQTVVMLMKLETYQGSIATVPSLRTYVPPHNLYILVPKAGLIQVNGRVRLSIVRINPFKGSCFSPESTVVFWLKKSDESPFYLCWPVVLLFGVRCLLEQNSGRYEGGSAFR